MPYAPLELARLKHWWSHHSAARSALAIKYVAECDSTNAQLYRSPSQHHTLLVAERQTHGRGQFERVWRSQAGDLIFSLGLSLPLDAIPALSRVAVLFTPRPQMPGMIFFDILIKKIP